MAKDKQLGINTPAFYIEHFFTDYLQAELRVSHHTIRSYRDTFVLLLQFLSEQKNVDVDMLSMDDINRDTVTSFLKWLQVVKRCSIRTRNQRLCALKSFARYLKYEAPQKMHAWEAISSIRNQKEMRGKIRYISVDAVALLLKQVDISTLKGRRDLTLLTLLYRTAIRASELVALTPASLHLNAPAIIEVLGKGNKKRPIPLDDNMVELLTQYMSDNRLNKYGKEHHPLFYNSRGEALTTAGVTYILHKYLDKAKAVDASIYPEKFSPHNLRSTKAMHWLQAGVDLYYIKDLLGHSSIQTTEIYARADTKAKRDALERAYNENREQSLELPSWQRQPKLLDMLKSLSARR